MMRHPNDGVLRRLIDEPIGVSDADRAHVAQCAQCLDEVATMRVDSELVGAAMRPPPGNIDVDAAWERFATSSTTPATSVIEKPTAPTPITAAPSKNKPRYARKSAIAVVAVGAILVGGTAAAANNWLQIFKTEQLAPVNFSTDDLATLPDLRPYGDFKITGSPDPQQVANAKAAEAKTGLDIPTPYDLPGGISGKPTYQVIGKVSATFTFDEDRAAAAVAESGATLPPPPPGLDGSTVRIQAGPAVAAVWSQGSGIPTLVVGKAIAPTAESTGVSFDTFRDYLLSLPGIPNELADQLRSIGDSSLPIPVPQNWADSSPIEIDGHPATRIETKDGLAAAVIWVDHGVISAVAGMVSADEAAAIAESLDDGLASKAAS